MSVFTPIVRFIILLVIVLTCSCSTLNKQDFSSYRAHMPGSILVLPPLNESTDVNAPYVYLSTISEPLANRGYYVFPVAVIDAFMKDNGLQSPYDMHNVPLHKLGEIFGADAVLYVTIEEWGQHYIVLASSTVVKARAQLVDIHSGETIWTGTQHAVDSSSSGGSDPIGMIVAAAIEQVIDTLTDQTYDLSRRANFSMIHDSDDGFLLGHYHPKKETDLRGR